MRSWTGAAAAEQEMNARLEALAVKEQGLAKEWE